ncbi:MAG: Pr6Pr family membrane protein [Jatrophihabitantaceae bacterium]
MATNRPARPSTARPATGVWLLPTVRTLFALLGFSALVTEIATLAARHRFNAGNFFSYFTVESNTLAVICLIVSAFAAAAGRQSRQLDFFRGAVTLYMTTVILIFIVLLSGYPSSDLTAVPWDNTVLHYIMPIVLMVDWLLADRPITVPFNRAVSWLVVPLAYLAYSLIRGPVVHWYPYPFMDPSRHGYLGIAITSVVIAVVLAAITWLLACARRWQPVALLLPRAAGR